MTDTSQPTARDATTASRNAGSAGMKILAGVAAGAVGVWALDRIDWFMWNRENPAARARTTAVRPDGEPPAQALVSKIEDATGTHLEPAAHEAVSQAVHYLIGIAPAVGYALLRNRLPVAGVARGALYGVGLFLTQDEVLNTVTGLGAKPQRYPWQAHARGIVAHTVYGVATEFAHNFFDKAVAKRASGVTRAQLKAAVKKAGVSATAVAAELGK